MSQYISIKNPPFKGNLKKLYETAKGQIILKGPFCYPRILPKNKQMNFLYIIVKMNSFVWFFLEEFEDTKSHFEII